MNPYEELLTELNDDIIVCDNANLPNDFSGVYSETIHGKVILLNKNLKRISDKRCILAEEIGHCLKNHGIIQDQDLTVNRKQEKIARRWSYNKLIKPLDLIIAFEHGIRNKYELAEYLNVTESFLQDALKDFSEQHGPYYRLENYTICFEPLSILKMFDDNIDY